MRDETLLAAAGVVRFSAASISRNIPRRSLASIEDLEQEGWLAVIDSARRFDPSRGFKLASYARRRIQGAMLDSLRCADPLSREHRRAVKAGRAPDIRTVGLGLGSQGEMKAGPIAVRACERAAAEQRALEARIDVERLLGLAQLKPRYEYVVVHYFLCGEEMRAIGRALGVNESRVSQICKAAVGKLRALTVPASSAAAATRPEAPR
jgi:RNA polymerase sigma factor (sigma-70 family)